MTLLTKFDARIVRDNNYRLSPYYLPSYCDPRATMTRLCWLLHTNPHLSELRISGLVFKDDRDVCLFTTALSDLSCLWMLKLSASYWEGTSLSLPVAIVLGCPARLRRLTMALRAYNFSDDSTVASHYREMAPGGLQSWELRGQKYDLTINPTKAKLLTNLGILELRGQKYDLTINPTKAKLLTNLGILDFKDLDEVLSESELRTIAAHCPSIRTFVAPTIGVVEDIGLLAKDLASSCRELDRLGHQESTRSADL
ncbi:hypothetical protein BGW39_000388 [Mortierella sp. 14UC]|nr:hypothetical protein BGW39_000388 [Mortierella sp. 14UC]